MILTDGTGKGISAKVDGENRLHVFSQSLNSLKAAIFRGDAYAVSTDFTQLTTDGESALMYIKNESDRDVFLDIFRFVAGASTNGSGPGRLRIQVNPTAGTVIDDAINLFVANVNLGSQNTFNGFAYAGGEGKTLTGFLGQNTLLTPKDEDRYEANLNAILPKGFAVGVSYQPPAGNTDMLVQLLIGAYYIDAEGEA